MRTARFIRLAALALLGAAASAPAAAKWEELEDCVLSDGYMDGDSFHVRHGSKIDIIRLYFVDTPESDKQYAERNEDQAAYFGITDAHVVPLGVAGKKFTQKTLSGKKFTVWTRWEDA